MPSNERLCIDKQDARLIDAASRLYQDCPDHDLDAYHEALWRWLNTAIDHLIEDADHWAAGPHPIAGHAFQLGPDIEPHDDDSDNGTWQHSSFEDPAIGDRYQ